MNYYNDNDASACAWLRELIAGGLIPAGDVDERSIWDVEPGELDGYEQCHFCAGIGGGVHNGVFGNGASRMTEPKICKCEGCDKPVAKGRRRYCSEACYKKTARALGAAWSRRHRDGIAARDRAMFPHGKYRNCLRCGKRFWSRDFGNRLCGCQL